MYDQLFDKGRAIMRKLGMGDLDLSNRQSQRTVGMLFGDVWADDRYLSLQERSLVTLACLVALGGVEDPPLTHHIRGALHLGIAPEKIEALITHLAFYAGYPKSAVARKVMMRVFKEEGCTLAPPSP